MKKILVFGSLFPVILYAIFAFLIIGLTGDSVSQVATVSLGYIFNDRIMVLVNMFAMITMATAFIALGYALKEMFEIDLRMNKHLALSLVLLVPVLLVLLGVDSFVRVIGITGALTGGSIGIMVILMHKNSKKMGNRVPEYAVKDVLWFDVLIMALFAVALFAEFISLFSPV